jgi:hypothetical protein
MHKLSRITPPLSFVLVFAVAICLASPASGSKDSAAKNSAKTSTKTTSKNSPATRKTTEKTPAKSSVKKKTSHSLASAEDLSGTISVVSPSDKEITLVASNGVPYDFDLTRKTRVELSDKNIGVKELPSENHRQATVHFVPTSRGNLAESIRISTS